jgi:hypothetical protein
MTSPDAEHPRYVVELLERHAREYEPAPRFTPQLERWMDNFASLRRRLRRAIASDAERDTRFTEMAERHHSDEVKALLGKVRDRLLACCDALQAPLRTSKDKAGHWDAEEVLRVFPVPGPSPARDRRHGAMDARQATALKPLLEVCQDDKRAVKMVRRAIADYLQQGEAKWRDVDMLEWMAIGLPKLCDLDYVTRGPIGVLKERSPAGVRRRLRDCQHALGCLRQIEGRLLAVKRLSKSRKDAAKLFEARATKAEGAIATLRGHLDSSKEQNETAYWLNAVSKADSLRDRLGLRADLGEGAERRRRVHRAVADIKRLTEWLLAEGGEPKRKAGKTRSGPQIQNSGH